MRVIPKFLHQNIKLVFELRKVLDGDVLFALTTALFNALFSDLGLAIEIDDQSRVHNVAAHVGEKLRVNVHLFLAQNAFLAQHFHKARVTEKA